MKTTTAPRTKGFTLIEVLVVIAIMGLLAALAWTATGLVRSRQDRKTAETDISLMEASLNSYKADFGGIMPYAEGDEWSGHVLYSMLSGDDDNDGRRDKDKNGNLKTAYCSTLAINTSNKSETQIGLPAYKVKLAKSSYMPKNLRSSKAKRFAIIDPWGAPYRYRLGCEADSDNKEIGMGINADFDLYSLGADGLGDALNQKGENQDNVTNISSFQ